MLKSRRSLYLNASVSAGALAIAVLAATPASAANECGTPSGGIVQCDESDSPFNGGINYDVDGDFTLEIEDGLSIAPDAGSSGIVVLAPTGSVVISAAGADVTSEDAGAIGVAARGDIAVEVDDLTTSGLGAWGITTYTFEGETRIFIHPPKRIRSVDLLLTNFHLPESTLLMLVSAFSGRERILAAYAHAVRERYRFFSYGDAMLLYPESVA